MGRQLGYLLAAALVLATAGGDARAGDAPGASGRMRHLSAGDVVVPERHFAPDPVAPRDADWPELTASPATARGLPASASGAAPRPSASPAIGIAAILAPALLVLLASGIALAVLGKKLDAAPLPSRHRSRRRRSSIRRHGA